MIKTARNTYIISNDFYIRNDLQTFLLYFDYFLSPGLSLSFKNNFLQKICFSFIRIFIILLFITKLYKFRYALVQLPDDARIIFKGSGQWSNTIKLIEKNGKLKILKKVYNKKIYVREQSFYNTYKKNKSKIKLPNYSFVGNNTIEMEFLHYKSFRRLIIEGTLSLDQSLRHFQNIKLESKLLYGNKKTLIHGDFWLTNIFINKDNYYIIDFSDSLLEYPQYDLYQLFYSILATYRIIKPNSSTISDKIINTLPVNEWIGSSLLALKNLEERYVTYRRKRFPELLLK